MKKFIALTAAAVMALTLTACGEMETETNIETEKYTQQDVEDTTNELLGTMYEVGVNVDRINYFGDDLCNDEAIETMKEIELIPQDSEAKDCIGYMVDYHYSRSPGSMVRNYLAGTYEPGEFCDIQVWYIKNEEGRWERVSIGDEII